MGRNVSISRTLIILFAVLIAAGIARADGIVSGKIQDADGNPIEGATVRVAGGPRTTTDADGLYRLRVPSGSQQILIVALGYNSTGTTLRISDGDEESMNFALQTALSQFGEQVVVLGSRSHRTALDTPVPVDVLSAEDLADNGQTETARKIQFLAPSFNVSTSTISDGSDIVRPSTLRGLGPDQTLVLVNGKRRHNSALIHVNGSIGRGTAGVDLNAIPSSAIQTVEVLRDGAAAQYGSDAIAGVLNLQLNRSTGVTHVELNTGQHNEEDGETTQASVNRGWEIGDDGFVNVTLEFRDRGSTDRSGLDPRRIFNFQEQVPGTAALEDSDGDGVCDSGGSCTPDAREATYNRNNHRYGDADSQNIYLFANSEIPIGDDWVFYGFGGFASREGESAGFNRLPSQGRTNVGLWPEGHLPLINTEVDDGSLAFGIKRSFSNLSMDLSLTTGANEFNFDISDSANTSLGPASPLSADAGTLTFGQVLLNADFFGGTTWGGKQVAYAFGAEFRQDNYEIEAGDDASWIDGGVLDQFGEVAPAGIQVFPGFRPTNEVDEDRDNVAVYGDLEIDFNDRFLLALAARFEDYSDFGNQVSGKIAGRYEVTENFALRGSANTGFRAPSLHQSHFNNISTQFVDVAGVITPLEVGTFRISDPVAQALGAVPLEEETSTSYSFGFTARPLPNLSITTDVFSIDIEDRVVLSGRFSDSNPLIAPLLAPFGVAAAQFFTNAIDTETEGIDVVLAYSHPMTGDASLSLTAAASYNKTELDGAVRTPAVLTGLGETLFDDIEVTYVEKGQPRQLYNFGMRYANGPFSAMMRLNYFGSVASTESASDPARKQKFAGKQLTDLDLSYRFSDQVKLSVGGNNIFDVYPDKNIASNSFNGIFVYPRRTAPFGFNGGSYYVRVGLDF